MKKETEKIIEIINKLKPFLINDGGNIEFVKYEDVIIYIKMFGSCEKCQITDLNLKEVIESAIMTEVEGVRGVINIA